MILIRQGHGVQGPVDEFKECNVTKLRAKCRLLSFYRSIVQSGNSLRNRDKPVFVILKLPPKLSVCKAVRPGCADTSPHGRRRRSACHMGSLAGLGLWASLTMPRKPVHEVVQSASMMLHLPTPKYPRCCRISCGKHHVR